MASRGVRKRWSLGSGWDLSRLLWDYVGQKRQMSPLGRQGLRPSPLLLRLERLEWSPLQWDSGTISHSVRLHRFYFLSPTRFLSPLPPLLSPKIPGFSDPNSKFSISRLIIQYFHSSSSGNPSCPLSSPHPIVKAMEPPKMSPWVLSTMDSLKRKIINFELRSSLTGRPSVSIYFSIY